MRIDIEDDESVRMALKDACGTSARECTEYYRDAVMFAEEQMDERGIWPVHREGAVLTWGPKPYRHPEDNANIEIPLMHFCRDIIGGWSLIGIEKRIIPYWGIGTWLLRVGNLVWGKEHLDGRKHIWKS